MKQILRPAKIPRITDFISSFNTERKRLHAWGFLDNPEGMLAERTDEHEIYGWLGRVTLNKEAPVIVLVQPRRITLKEDWYYGYVRTEGIDRSAIPIDAILDAAEHSTVAVKNSDSRLVGVIRALDGIMPTCIQYDYSLSEQ